MIKIGERVEIVEEGDKWPRSTVVKLDDRRVGCIQSLSLCFDANKSDLKELKIIDFGEPEARALQVEFAAELVRCGFNVHWVSIDELPNVKPEQRTEKPRTTRAHGRWKPRRGYAV